MNHYALWAPWRLGYITAANEPPLDLSKLPWLPKADRGCFLCRAAVDPDRQATLTVAAAPAAIVVLNRYPYNNGHLLVAPRRHVGRLDQLTDVEQRDVFGLLTRMTQLLETELKSEGLNIGLNLGRVAGAGVPGHLHWHVVPRWSGDTNFMPATAGIRVIPQSLESLWELLSGKMM